MKYKYLIYKIYSWTKDKKGDTPIVNTILTLTFTHFIQMFVLLMYVDKFITPIKWLKNINKTSIYIGGPIYYFAFYLLVYNKKRWDAYVEEFKDESEKQRKCGNFIVIAYLIGSILLFFISLPILYG